MQALILAGGKGTRLRPYTAIIPKPLLPVGDYPILEIILRQLKQADFKEVILAVGYMSHLFESIFQQGERFGLKIRYSFEEKPLGTAGPISLALDRLEDDFMVMNGDLLTTLNFRNLFDFHKQKAAAATIGLYEREVKIDFGVIETNEENRLIHYTEKPAFRFDVSMGINVLHKESVQPYLESREQLDLPDLMLKLIENDLPVYCYREKCYWLDMGRLDDYEAATEVFESRKKEFLTAE